MNKALSLNLNMQATITEAPQFFTGTILEWKRLLKPEKYKDIIISSLQFLVENNRVKVNAFVVMDNHIHLIWQMMAGIKPEAVQRDFMKFTAQKIRQDLIKNHPAVLAHFKVNAKDRKYQFWERNALSVELSTLEMLKQKLEYIHYNPVIAGICNLPEEYKYSTAKFYEIGVNDWGFVTHYTE
jgi:putative transposase